MPAREERLLWIHGRSLNQAAADLVEAANGELVRAWSGPEVTCIATVQGDGSSDRLWLFRIRSGDQKVATEFTKRLRSHIDHLKPLRLKRQVNLPTPLVAKPYGGGHKLDLGLHVVNDIWNGSLMLFFYYEGRFYNPPHLQLPDMRRFADVAAALWRSAACDCHGATHCPDGCWECFNLRCSRCEGTGWKDYSLWLRRGPRIDYSSGWPLAMVENAV